MESFIIEGGHPLKGTITPQGAKNEALQVICTTILTDEPYAPGTAEYDSFMAIYNRLSPIFHKIFKGDEIDNVIKGILYDGGFSDSDAVLEVPEFID